MRTFFDAPLRERWAGSRSIAAIQNEVAPQMHFWARYQQSEKQASILELEKQDLMRH